MPQSLWKTSDPQRFFVVADDVELPPGPLKIRNLAGRTRAVDEESVVPHEVTEAQATEWMRAQVSDLLGGVRGWLDNGVDRLTGADADPVSALRGPVDRVRHLAERDLAAADAAAIDDLADKLQSAVDRLRTAAERIRSGDRTRDV
jgi:hypothetical protein